MTSIASAPGWKARFADGRVVTLVSWALVEDGGATEIVGVIQRAANEESPNGWLGFADDVDEPRGKTHRYGLGGELNQISYLASLRSEAAATRGEGKWRDGESL